MKKNFLSIAFMAMSSVLLTGCLGSDDNKSGGDTEIVVTKGAVVLCGGSAADGVKSSLYYLDFEAGTSRVVNSDLGMLANDVIEFNDKLYVTGSGSNTIFVLNADNFQLLDQIDTEEEMGEIDGIGPRCMAAYDNKLYVTTSAGFVGIFDVSSTTPVFVNKVKVGNEPEGLCFDMKDNVPLLYVCCSGSINGQPTIATVTLGSTPSVSSFSNEIIRQPMEVASAGGELIFVRDEGYLDDTQVQKEAGIYAIAGNSAVKLIPDATGMAAAGYDILTYNKPFGTTGNPTYSLYNLNNAYGGYTGFTLSGDSSSPVLHPSLISIDPNPYASIVLVGSLADAGGSPVYSGGSFVNRYQGNGTFAKTYPVGDNPIAVTYLYKTAKYSEVVKQ